MQAPLSRWLSQQSADMSTATYRQELLDRGLDLVRGTALVPTPYERSLLDQFVRGHLSLDQVLGQIQEHDQDDA